MDVSVSSAKHETLARDEMRASAGNGHLAVHLEHQRQGNSSAGPNPPPALSAPQLTGRAMSAWISVAVSARL